MSNTNFSATGGVTIKRLRNGDTLFVLLTTDKPLFQAVDTQTGGVVPQWTNNTANQPTITPTCYTAKGINVVLTQHKWYWNSVENPIEFPSGSAEWLTSSDGHFQLKQATGELKIIKDLASKDNPANDTLTYKAVASVAGVEYPIMKSIDVVIHSAGESSYNAYIFADRMIIDEDNPTANLTAQAICGLSDVTSSLYCVWTKNGTSTQVKSGSNTLAVGRENVDGDTLYVASFYASSAEVAAGNVLCRAYIRITDRADEYAISFTLGDNKQVDTGKPVVVTATVMNMSKNTAVDMTGKSPVWGMKALRSDTLAELKSTASNTITITTAETDVTTNGKTTYYDVMVVAEVSW